MVQDTQVGIIAAWFIARQETQVQATLSGNRQVVRNMFTGRKHNAQTLSTQ